MAKIEKICLEVGGKKIELSLKEAKQLKEILLELFPENQFKQVLPSPIIIQESSPIIIEDRRHKPWYPHSPIWYSDTHTSGTLCISSNSENN